ncbi:MAG: hypothetical protein IPM51_06955 [Sphingobacteriaceae bacterium]|nr:hypothetical protein [Sphingobacteriaceae bacterium]
MIDIPAPPNKNHSPLSIGEGSGVRLESQQAKLARLLASQQQIKESKCKPISFSQPILWQKENPVFFPKTINVIQGKAGVHKSRLAETICAALLKTPESNRDLLEFKRNILTRYAVCYVDTERNLSDQLPYSLQQIQLKAGYPIEEHPYGFDYISLLEFAREERFEMLNMYLDYIRQKFPMHLFIILDVITDCVFNFNDTKDSMKLIDMMNQTINRYDVTFLALIHENPGSTDKARGHLGTEILNKASTVIQIGFEKDSENHNTNLIKVNYLKCRSSRKHDPFFAEYSDIEKGLIIADPNTIKESFDSRNQKAALDETIEIIAHALLEPMPKSNLIEKLCLEMNCRERTVETRLKSIITHKLVIPDANGTARNLCKRQEGKEVIYFLSE